MSRPKGSAQFEGDVDKAVKEFVRNATDRREVLKHAAVTLHRMSRECVRLGQDGDAPLQAVDEEIRKIAELCAEAPASALALMRAT